MDCETDREKVLFSHQSVTTKLLEWLGCVRNLDASPFAMTLRVSLEETLAVRRELACIFPLLVGGKYGHGSVITRGNAMSNRLRTSVLSHMPNTPCIHSKEGVIKIMRNDKEFPKAKYKIRHCELIKYGVL